MAFYAVKEGRVPGVYATWGEAEAQVKGFNGAKFKKFTNYDDACEFAGMKASVKPKEAEISSKPLDDKEVLYAYVDGSFKEEANVAGYGLLLVKNGEVIFRDLGAFRETDLNESRNVFGELRGALKAVELAIANGFKSICIVYDYAGIEAWATDKWKANKPLTQDYKAFMKKYMKIINITFKKVKSHASEENGGDRFNAMADKLAEIAVNL